MDDVGGHFSQVNQGQLDVGCALGLVVLVCRRSGGPCVPSV